ncbi:MAG: NmrA/HSCARG family protein [Gammaproteobacteria bacterium]|nr:NmrA/HSCARG family protein [Gammaproteobacteria bacterium]
MTSIFTRLMLLLTVLLAGCTAVPSGSELILVGGATGRQGSAVVDELLSRGYRVRALTRKPDGRKALALSARGVEVVAGNYGDRASLDAAMNGVSRLFFYSGFSRNELEEGRTVIASARAAGIRHLIYSSGAAAEPGVGIPGAKMTLEQEIIASGIPYTVFRPVAFMENYAGLKRRFITEGVIDSRAPDRLLHFIAVRDIGLLVGAAFAAPDDWQGLAINIAGDRLSVADHVAVISDVTGEDIRYKQLPLDEFLDSLPPPLRPLFRWYHEVGYTADVDALREQFPQLMTLRQWLEANGWGD